jgi:crotonobetainyl-CoA:carnitine CoA-transferase CaiB-like acyl-CoA transferase
VTDSDMGGQFNNKNPGKRGISLNVRDPKGLDIARRLVAISDIVAEGLLAGRARRLGVLATTLLRSIKPDIIYAQQSGMGSAGTYGRFRAVGPFAAALAGTVGDVGSALRPRCRPAGAIRISTGSAAYSFATRSSRRCYRRDRTGLGQHIDASQCETGIFLTGVSVLDWSVNGREFSRYGNRSPYKRAHPTARIRPRDSTGGSRSPVSPTTSSTPSPRLPGIPSGSPTLDLRRLESRWPIQDALDATIAGWTKTEDGYGLMHALQAAGVAAGVCPNRRDRCDHDPQLAALEWLTEVPGTKIGTWPVADIAVKMSATPAHAAARSIAARRAMARTTTTCWASCWAWTRAPSPNCATTA